MPRRNRVDPWGDLHAASGRGLFTGNRGCVVDDRGEVVRHHGSSLWIICLTSFRGWRSPLAAPRRWTPLFFLDDAVALAAGHRPCGLCRREDHRAYRDAVGRAERRDVAPTAAELNRGLSAERLRRGQGLARAADRLLWTAPIEALPTASVIVWADHVPRLVLEDRLLAFSFDGWNQPSSRPPRGTVTVLTPPTSVAALAHGYRATLHPSAERE
jgi:hypothetical protein